MGVERDQVCLRPTAPFPLLLCPWQLPKILRAVKFDSAGSFPRGYEADLQRALLTFRHQVSTIVLVRVVDRIQERHTVN